MQSEGVDEDGAHVMPSPVLWSFRSWQWYCWGIQRAAQSAAHRQVEVELTHHSAHTLDSSERHPTPANFTMPCWCSRPQEFVHTRAAMAAIGIGAEQQEDVFRVLSALLHLGNISWQDSHHDSSSSSANGAAAGSNGLCNGTAEAAAAAAAMGGCPLAPGPESPAALAAAARLLGRDAGALARALSTRTR